MAARHWHLALLAAAAFAIIASQLAVLPPAYGHASAVNSSPRPFQSLAASPKEVQISYSEPVELSYSTVTVLGPDGSRVDLNDAHFVNGNTQTVAVTLQPGLREGVYTVTSRTLSAIDGHITDSAFTFGVGVKPGGNGPSGPAGAPSQVLYPLESASRFPGMVGQIIVVGAAFGTLWLWRPLEKIPWLAGAISSQRLAINRRMSLLVIIGTTLVLASNVAIISVQAYDIKASIADAIATKFGGVWMTRMIEASILMIIAIYVWRKMAKSSAPPSKAEILAILVMGLAVLVTSSLIAHGAATGQVAAILLDFFHNAAASIWIGGLVLMGFVAMPRILSLKDEQVKSVAVSILIPRFSTIVVTILGLALITGPLLLYLIESDLSLTLASTYGKVLMVKLGLAGVMVAMGAYSQFVIQKKAAVALTNGSSAADSSGARRFAKSLKVEAAIGIALLLAVSLMANSSLPANEFPQSQQELSQQQSAFAQTGAASSDYRQILYASSGGRVDLTIGPFAVGQNKFVASFYGPDGKLASDVSGATIKITQVEKNVGPIAIDTKKVSPGVFSADAAFGLPGTWNLVVEGTRPQSASIVASASLDVRPAMADLSFDVKEYRTPTRSQMLFPVFDPARQSIWSGDSLLGSGRIWQLDINTGNYVAHRVQNTTLVTQVVLDPSGKLWYIDPIAKGTPKIGKLGLYDPDSNTTRIFMLPAEGIPTGLAQDLDGNLWVPIREANSVAKFDPKTEKFTQVPIPTPEAVPVGLQVDRAGNVWVAESIGKIARIDPATGNVTEFAPKGANKLETPTAVYPDPSGSTIFIAEHGGHTVTAFNTLFETFREYPVLNEAGLPFGMAQDSFGNLWFAQHEIDRIGIIDPRTGQGTEVKIPTSGSIVQWITPDDKGRIWFAEQGGSALGVATVTAGPPSQQQPGAGQQGQQPPSASPVPRIGFAFSDVVGPAVAAGIVLSALFYAKSATDLKRSVRTAEKMSGKEFYPKPD
ncbi:MAG: copper resistance protein CopC [Nitrososphaera sp.]|jgi:copper transport protein